MDRVECFQSKKAYYNAVIQSRTKPKRRGNSDAECIQSVPPPKPPFKQGKKPERDGPTIQSPFKQEKKQERERPAIQSAKETRER
jgi:hypothetical protein